MPDFLKYLPTVYCVRDKYQIIFVTNEAGAGAVIIDGKRYTDNVCGVVRSATCVHRIEIDTDILDRAGRYTVELKRIPDRAPYTPVTVSTERRGFSFRGLPTDRDINCYVISDTHGFAEVPVKVGGYFGDELDLLILGGDMGRNVTDEKEMMISTAIASELAKGEIPVIFMRGNHDTRGAYAELLPDYVGTDNGLTYFPIRLGRLWFVLLDSGEDKPDDHWEYGDIADYGPMREAQIRMLEDMAENSDNRYHADGAEVRIALSHTPLRCCGNFPELFAKWAELLNKLGIHAMLSGHTHRVLFTPPEKAPAAVKHNFPCVECAAINKENISAYKGTAITVGKNIITVRFTDVDHNVTEEHTVTY